MGKNIICPVDFTEVASKALDYASLFAQRMKGDLIMLHAIDETKTPSTPQEGSPFAMPGGYERQVNQKLEGLREDIEQKYGVNVRTQIDFGLLEDVIAKATQEEAALIVIGTTGAEGIREVFEGTHTVKVIEKTDCPVLVIPEEAEFSFPNYWVYATDLEKNTEQTASKIWELCSLFDAKLDLLYVERKKENKEHASIPVIDEKTKEKISFHEIRNKNVLKAINNYVGEKDPDILAVAEHEHGKWNWLIKEDKISKIVENANFPILVVPEKTA